MFPSERVKPYDEQKTPSNPNALHVMISREPWGDYFRLTLDNGFDEELECGDPTREWFKVRGANMEAVERALDYCFNFYLAEIWINNPIEPTLRSKVTPNI